jgi:hypothetical protein
MSIEAENNPVHEAVLFYWGERCPDFDPTCVACNAWKLYDEMLTNVSEGAKQCDPSM